MQIAGICLKLKIKPSDFAEHNLKRQDILKFLVEADKAEQEILKQENEKKQVEKI